MNLAPVTRITIGLVLLTVSILIAGNLIGLTPDTRQTTLDARQRFCETLAVQLSVALMKNELAMAQTTIEAVTYRDPDILSAALRRADGSLLVETQEHRRHWTPPQGELSTPSHVQIPVFQNKNRWGTVEISFAPLRNGGFRGIPGHPFLQLLFFVAVAGSLVYYLLIKKTLKYLDPSSVIPGRVKAALDILAEGVVLIDNRERVVLANTAFAKIIGVPASSLLGSQLSQLKWTNPKNGESLQRFPWSESIKGSSNRTGIPMALSTPAAGLRTLMVNSAPILDGGGKARGALTTFDDVTQLEQKNTQLEEMLHLLQDSQDKVHKQNEQLQILASRDSLTDCLNRRALFQQLEDEFERARHSGQTMCCVMCDIDHFKQINDRYGHVKGDRVIKEVAQALEHITRDTDAVGRYGGEEFCIVLPDIEIKQASQIVERFRTGIARLDMDGIRVTASFGVTSTVCGANDITALLQQADDALYQAKERGRNCVVVWEEQTQTRSNAS